MAIRLPSAWKEELLARTDIVSVVSGYVTLKKDGRRYWGLCPFHNEKTPSFSVNADLNMYYCFGCKATGDVIKFVMEMERAPFMDAVKILADRAHMAMPELQEDPDYERRRSQREKLLAASTTGKNESARGLMGRLRDFFDWGTDEDFEAFSSPLLLPDMLEQSTSPTLDWEWSMARYERALYTRVEQNDFSAKEAWDELEQSVVKNVADDVKVAIRSGCVEMIIIKKIG